SRDLKQTACEDRAGKKRTDGQALHGGCGSLPSLSKRKILLGQEDKRRPEERHPVLPASDRAGSNLRSCVRWSSRRLHPAGHVRPPSSKGRFPESKSGGAESAGNRHTINGSASSAGRGPELLRLGYQRRRQRAARGDCVGAEA